MNHKFSNIVQLCEDGNEQCCGATRNSAKTIAKENEGGIH